MLADTIGQSVGAIFFVCVCGKKWEITLVFPSSHGAPTQCTYATSMQKVYQFDIRS